MQKKFQILLAVTFISALAFLCAPNYGQAQVGLSLFPVKFNLKVEPGKTYSDTVTVINPNDFSIGVKPEIENVSGGDEGSIDLVERDIPHGLSAWMFMDMSSFDLGPKERKQIPFTISIPPNGEPGGHYGALLFRSIPPGGAPQSGVGLSGRIGSVILAEVLGETRRSGEIDSFVGPARYISRGPVEFSFKIKNSGNGHFEPTGAVAISNWFTNETEIPFESRVVFPDHVRTFGVEWPAKYGFGRMTAVLSVNMPNNEVATSTLTFFMFPWQEASIILLIILIIWLGGRTIKKNFKIVKVAK